MLFIFFYLKHNSSHLLISVVLRCLLGIWYRFPSHPAPPHFDIVSALDGIQARPASHGLQMTVQNSGIVWNVGSPTSLGPSASLCFEYQGGSNRLTRSLLIPGAAQSKHLKYNPRFLR